MALVESNMDRIFPSRAAENVSFVDFLIFRALATEKAVPYGFEPASSLDFRYR